MKFRLKGFEIYKSKFPDFPGARLLVFPAVACFVFIFLCICYFLSFYLPRLYGGSEFLTMIEPFLPLVLSVITTTVGFLLVDSIWALRGRMLRAKKEKALQNVYPLGLIGIPMIFSLIFHNILPFYRVISIPPNSDLSLLFERPVTSLSGLPGNIVMPISSFIGIIFMFFGILTVIRALNTFGIDYMGLVYLYYPEESVVQNHEIYSVIRHPAYFSLFLIGTGTLIMHQSVYQLVDLTCFFIGVNIHLHFFEERELLSRFGDSYKSYMKSTPWIYPKKIRIYLRFLFRR